jgi:hypothetical protein
MIAKQRNLVRIAFANLLTAKLTGDNGPVQDVYDYPSKDFAGHSPVITVSSGGTLRTPLSFQGMQPKYRLKLNVYVAYDETWTDYAVENALDTIESLIAEVLEGNQAGVLWQGLDQAAMSEADYLIMGGIEYRHEEIIVEVS